MNLRPMKWWQWILWCPALAALIGAIPQYIDWGNRYDLWRNFDVPFFKKLPADPIKQIKMWNENLNCYKEEESHTFSTKGNTEITVTVCPSTCAVLVVASKQDLQRTQWVAFDEFREQKSSHLFPSVQEVFAKENSIRSNMIVAQIGRVICQWRDSRGFIIRRVQYPNGNCEELVINPATGVVIERRPSNCDPC